MTVETELLHHVGASAGAALSGPLSDVSTLFLTLLPRPQGGAVGEEPGIDWTIHDHVFGTSLPAAAAPPSFWRCCQSKRINF